MLMVAQQNVGNKIPLQETRFDILGLTETHLNNKIEDDQISVDGYKMVRKDRISGSWGGCVMYYKKCLNVIERDDICSKSDLEQVWIDLMLASQRPTGNVLQTSY